jgi:hypothetical protein
MLDRAIGLAGTEFAALELEDATGLEESSVERVRLINEAWEGRADCEPMELRAKLSVLRELQKRLDALARDRFEKTREELKARRQADRVINVYYHKPRRSARAQMLAGNY